MKNTLNKKEIIKSTYEVQFFIGGDSHKEEYRVKGKDGSTYLLVLYNSSKLSIHDLHNKRLWETEILSSINANNIVQLVDHGELVKGSQKYHYVIFNFISGETIKEKVAREGSFSSVSAITAIIYLLETLQQIHQHQPAIIHNNINPESVYLDYTKAEIPVLADFGFARYITSKSDSIDPSRLSPFFVAPELYNRIFTPQSDLFSVGALLYYMTMGIPPWYFEIPPYQYSKERFIHTLHEKREEPLFFGLEGTEGSIDEQLQSVIRKALAISIDERFKNTEEFIQALKYGMILEGSSSSNAPAPVKRKGPGFSAIAGMQTLKKILHDDVINALNDKERYEEYGLTIPNGMLLYGPPGCGKTFISERFAEEVGFNFMELKPSDIKSKFINETEEKINKIFKEAEKKAPTIIFIDEIDAIVPSREGNLHQMHAAPVNEILSQMSNCSEKGIFVIAASNRPEKIDPAFLRRGRIDRIIYVPPPDYEARVEMFKLYLKKRPVDLGLDYHKLAEQTENFVSSDIKFLVDEASRVALKSNSRITQDIFDKVIKNTSPSLSQEELNKYEMLREQLENKSLKENKQGGRGRIGF